MKLTAGLHVIILFSSSQMPYQNKLVCLSFATVFKLF
jgi:hypothetical protein